VEELMNIPVNTSIDPTSAIAIGAAYFAGSKEFKSEGAAPKTPMNSQIKLRAVYNRNSTEIEETFTAKVEGNSVGLFYRISNDDSFDSGLKPLTTRIVEDLPLREGSFNTFTFKILDGQSNIINVGFDSIQITQGRYSVAGQMLPEDICLVRDDLSTQDTRLDLIFPKNCVLPTKGKRTVEIAKTIVKGSRDAIVTIMVVEGSSEKHSSTNKPIGILAITGEQISRDLLRGTEVDLTFEMSESRDLTVSAYLNGTGQEFSQVFKGQARHVDTRLLATEVLQLETKIQSEIEDAQTNDNQDGAAKLGKLKDELQSLMVESASLSSDDVTDDRFKLEDKKLRIAQGVFELTASKRIDAAKANYLQAKSDTASIVQESGNDRERNQMKEILAREELHIHSTNPERIDIVTSELQRLHFQVLNRQPDFLVGTFQHLEEIRPTMNDQTQAKQLIDHGRRLVANKAWDDLRDVNRQLWMLVPDTERTEEDVRFYTGIV
jgi:molecular chaperone DnaK